MIRLVSSAVIIRNFLLSSKHSAIGSRMFRSLPNILRRVGRWESNVFFRRVGRFGMVRSSESNAPIDKQEKVKVIHNNQKKGFFIYLIYPIQFQKLFDTLTCYVKRRGKRTCLTNECRISQITIGSPWLIGGRFLFVQRSSILC